MLVNIFFTIGTPERTEGAVNLYAIMNISFQEWLQREIDSRGWSQAELARRANTSRSSINGLLTGARGPGADLCVAIAGALHVPPETVFAAAGLYKPTYTSEDDRDPTLLEWIKLFKDADDEQREEMISLARYLATRGWQKRPIEK